MNSKMQFSGTALRKGLAATLLAFVATQAMADPRAQTPDVAVFPQYDTAHVYVAAGGADAFIRSFVATFGGQASKGIEANSASAMNDGESQYVWSPVGTLAVFNSSTPRQVPLGYMVLDMDKAIAEAKAVGAKVIDGPSQESTGRSAVVEWPGGVTMQLYSDSARPNYAPLASVPEHRVYVPRADADAFVQDFVRFSRGQVASDNRQRDATEIGRIGETYRRIRITSEFGILLVLATDGKLPAPFGQESSGYGVEDLATTIEKARAAGATVVSPSFDAGDRSGVMVQFPGGYVAEIHSDKFWVKWDGR